MKFPGLIATVAFSVCGFVVFGWNSALSAQQTRPTNIRVQLPTVSFFNLRTVVSVPDAGVMSLGGVSRSASGSSRWWPCLGQAVSKSKSRKPEFRQQCRRARSHYHQQRD